MNLKRDLVKYVRDKAKSRYQKGTNCFICATEENLDFHHYYGLTELLEIWLRKNKIVISTAEEIMEVRDTFIEEHTPSCVFYLIGKKMRNFNYLSTPVFVKI